MVALAPRGIPEEVKAGLSEALCRAIPFVISRSRNYPMDSLKQAVRATRMAGYFGQIARYMKRELRRFVERLGIIPGMKVLVACGTGKGAAPSGRKGAQVVSIDIAPNLLEQTRQPAVAESLEATFEEGMQNRLPYPDGHFDVVGSMFGATFAPRPDEPLPPLAYRGFRPIRVRGNFRVGEPFTRPQHQLGP